MRAGNHDYASADALPDVVPVFPLPAALLLPRAEMPLNIFEPRYVAMIDAALSGDRLIGMIQPATEAAADGDGAALAAVGCAGRITAFAETGDGRYLITLTGVARFDVLAELALDTPYRNCRIGADRFAADFAACDESSVDRPSVLKTFRRYLDAHDLQADWDSIDRASNEILVNALAMMAPFGPAEKQALLEAPDLRRRAETLVAITELMLAHESGDAPPLQ